MDKEVRKAIKRLLWLDSLFESSNSLWGVLDEIEDELEDIFGSSKNKTFRLDEWLRLEEDDDEK